MSLRARILLATAVVALLALVVADVVTYAELHSYLYGQVDQVLNMAHGPVEASVSGAGNGAPGPPPGRGPGTGGPSCPDFEGMAVDAVGLNVGTAIEVRNPAGAIVYQCWIETLGSTEARYPVLPARITGFTPDPPDQDDLTAYFTASATSGSGSFRVRACVIGAGPAAGDQLVLATPLGSTDSILHRLLLLEEAITAAALIGVTLLGWWVVRVSLRPIRQIEATAGAIAEGRLTERVPGDQARTEVGRLARALNVMLERIEGAFAQRDRTETELRASEERMRRFVADASHELRTPLAAVTAYAELFDRGAAGRPDDLRRVLTGIRHESARMGHLVEDLMLLARLDEGRPLQLEPLDLVELAGEAASTGRAVGPPWPVRIDAQVPVEVAGDALRLRQVLDNLLANVRTHCPPGTTTTITVSQDDDQAVVTVADDGPGLSPEQAARVFERFYRSDPSRSRDHGGSGLGLAIVDAIVRAHGGTVAATSGTPKGSVFTVRLPLRSSH